jgi:uncharacterized membrane protein (UPF0127 family)
MRRAAIAILIALAGIFLVVAGAIVLTRPQNTSLVTGSMPDGGKTVQLAGQTISVTEASDDTTREKGLGGRASLAENEGMLFIFPQDGIYPFWMKDMRFSIDILWLSDDGRIVYAVQDVSPDTYPNAFTPTSVARFVLELQAGWMAAHGVSVGDIVRGL